MNCPTFIITRLKLASALALITCLIACCEIFAQTSLRGKARVVPGEIVVKYRADVATTTAISSLQALGMSEIFTTTVVPFLRCKLAAGREVEAVLRACRQQPEIEYAEPNYYLYALESPPRIPNDAFFGRQWSLHRDHDHDIDAPEAWAITTGSDSVIVAIIDTGIDYRHPDLKDNIWINAGESGERANNGIDDDGNGYVDDQYGWNFVLNENDPYDDHFHGTHVAGTVGAVGNNRTGIAGVCWRVKLMALKFIGSDGWGTTAAAAEAIRYAVNNGAKILSNSWGGDDASEALKDEIEYAHERGVLFIAAAGNDGLNNDHTPHYPSSYDVPNVVSVASSTWDDKLSSFSNYGRRSVDIAAPGSEIYSTQPISRFQTLSGTSMATPHVSGVCALVWAQYPDLQSHEVLARVLGSADHDSEFTFRMTSGGRLNAAQALSTAPLIAFATDMSYTLAAGPYSISATVVDDGQIASVNLVYVLNNISSDTLAMTLQDSSRYQAAIPGQPNNTMINYKIVAADDDGNFTSSQNYHFKITSEPDPRDKRSGCGSTALSMQSPDGPVGLALAVPLNVAFFLLPIMLLRRSQLHQNS